MGIYFNFSILENIGTITFDFPGEKINKLSADALNELSEILDDVRSIRDIDVLVIQSGKPDMFIAGADISEIQAIATADEGFSKAKLGQHIFDRLAGLPIPTIAAIDGPALGGGLELALACTFRFVSDNPKTQLGLPEVNLGIIPGFGGTQRLPRLIGVQASLPLIVSGRSVDGPKAEKMALADRCVSSAFFNLELKKFVLDVVRPDTRSRIISNRKRRMSRRWIELIPGAIGLIGAFAKNTVTIQTKGHYPAPYAAIQAVIGGISLPLGEGLNREAKLFSGLIETDISKNLTRLFFIQESLKKYSGVPSDTPSRPVRSVGVIGAGLMGGGIGWLVSSKSFPVRIKDISWTAIGLAFNSAGKIYRKLVESRRISKHVAEMGIQGMSATTDYSGFSNVDFVIEAVVEDINVKKSVFSELEHQVRPDTVIASNTSSLSITEMAAALTRPNRFIGMHFFSPVNRMPLVEVIPGDHTSPETIATTVQFAKNLKKTPIVVKNCPGFLVNRLLIPYVNEAVFLLEDGIAVSQIDRSMEHFGMPLGPLALADEVGLDVGYKVAKILEVGYGTRMTVASSFSAIHSDPQLKGKKTGKGFYLHSADRPCVNPEIAKLISYRPGHVVHPSDVVDRLILIMVNEAARCIDEGVVERPELLDMAMVLGTGFPPFRVGLCRYADQRGISEIVTTLTHLANRCGERFIPAERLTQMAKEGATFY